MVFEISITLPKLPPALRPKVTPRIIAEESSLAVKRGATIMLKAVREATPKVTKKTERGWERIPVRRSAGTTSSGVVIKPQNKPPGVVGWVLERGRRKGRKMPPVTTRAEPALAEWFRKGPVGSFTVSERVKGTLVKRPANLGNKRDLRKLGFVIGRAIKRRGLPSKFGVPINVFTKKLERKRTDIARVMNKFRDRIIARLS